MGQRFFKGEDGVFKISSSSGNIGTKTAKPRGLSCNQVMAFGPG